MEAKRAAKELKRLERRALVMDLTRAGLSVRAISSLFKENKDGKYTAFGYISPKTVASDRKIALAQFVEDNIPGANEARALVHARYEWVWSTLYPAMSRGSDGAIRNGLQVLKGLREIYGLDPAEPQVTINQVTNIMQQSQSIKIDASMMEQVVKTLQDSDLIELEPRYLNGDSDGIIGGDDND